MSVIDTFCESICKCEYNSSGTIDEEEPFINYEKEVKGKELKILIFFKKKTRCSGYGMYGS